MPVADAMIPITMAVILHSQLMARGGIIWRGVEGKGEVGVKVRRSGSIM